MRLFLCSFGADKRSNREAQGLIFLSILLRRAGGYQLKWIEKKSIKDLTKSSCDALLISVLSYQALPELYVALRGRKPACRTIIGGPGAYACGVLRHLCDAVIVGRGEEAIFSALKGDYDGMATNGELKANSVKVFKTTLLSPEMSSVGCGFKCSFCQYGWGNVFAVDRESVDSIGKNYKISSINPEREQILMKITPEQVRTSKYRKPIVAGIDGICKEDLILTRKPLSFEGLRAWMRRIGESFNKSEHFFGVIRGYIILNYPWHEGRSDLEELYELQDLAVSTRQFFPPDVMIQISIGITPFIPMLLTPLEQEPCLARSPRDEIWRHHAPCGGAFTRGFTFTLDPLMIPSCKHSIIATLLQRADDLNTLRDCAEMTWQQLAQKYASLLGRQPERPAPWLQAPNDLAFRKYAYYRDLDRLFPGLVDPDFQRPQKAAVAQHEALVVPRLTIDNGQLDLFREAV